ncbi:MAG: RdgB/HAM1 family non-canonical purine NTP pyrophosphatase [Acidobacteriota bacterium]|nr:RdgB/HAM1 family non-canonical purine NTP pyrophosphatase [Acidobacteriota bacterium]
MPRPPARTKHENRPPGKPRARPRRVGGKRVLLFVATKNPGKARELEELLEGRPVKVIGPSLMKGLQAPVEDGATFEANAVKKALHYSRLVEHIVLADDSGLEVEALDGKPGVRSARLGGPAATDADRVRLVLHMLEDVPWEQRTARFRCAIALARRGNLLEAFSGSVEGLIKFEPEGASGFGYDPVFFYPPEGKTFAEMTPEEKHRVSHRGQALARAVGWIESWTRGEIGPDKVAK